MQSKANVPIFSLLLLTHESANVSAKGLMVNSFGFAGRKVSVTTTLCVKPAMDNLVSM